MPPVLRLVTFLIPPLLCTYPPFLYSISFMAKPPVPNEAAIHGDINHFTLCHSRECGNPGRSWIPGQARNDKQERNYVVMYNNGDEVKR